MKYGLIIATVFFNFNIFSQEQVNHCWLARLPFDVQQKIGGYLSINIKNYESTDCFIARLQSYKAQVQNDTLIETSPTLINIKKKAGTLILDRSYDYFFSKKKLVNHNKKTYFGILPKNCTNFFVVSPQRNYIAALIDDKKVKVFLAASGKLLKKFSIEMPEKVTGLAVNDNGHYVALANADSVWLKNLENNEYKVILDKKLPNFGITDKALISKILQKKYGPILEKGMIQTIGFDKQNTNIAARFVIDQHELEHFIFIALNKITENLLLTYFNKRGVCKNW